MFGFIISREPHEFFSEISFEMIFNHFFILC